MSEPAPLRALLWSEAAFLTGVLLHVGRLPLWAMVTAFVCAAWALAARTRRVALPGPVLRSVFALALLAVVLAMFRTLNGLAAGTALLVLTGSVKLLEASTRRDRYIVIGAALFLVLAASLEQQSLACVPLYALATWLSATALLVSAHPESSLGNADAARLAARSLVAALPLAVLLFLFFPRLAGSFWALPNSGRAATGLGDSMSPGSISDLSESADPAFRVWFDGPPPPPGERYWRGPVLHVFDGYTWSNPTWQLGRLRPPERMQLLGVPYSYQVELEPHSRNWWFALDTVQEWRAPMRAVLTRDRQLVSDRPVTERTTYRAVSRTLARSLDPLSSGARAYDLDLRRAHNPRTVELARRLRTGSAGDGAFIGAVLQLFRTGGFAYTLTPPLLSADSVDDFLFRTRLGFCGHYASAFVTLMRAGGIPARIVTGYLGGEWNPLGGYYVIRQSDAHAWAEVWLEGRGWTRIDPTSVVEPERLERGILDLMPNAVSASDRLIHRFRWLTLASQGWDAVNAWWALQVVGFDLKSQLGLLERIGIESPDWPQLGAALALALVAAFAVLGWRSRHRVRPAPPDAIARAYRRLCARLAASGCPRLPHQGPLDYADTIAARRPQLAASVRPLLERYAALRFGPPTELEPRAVSEFVRAVTRLRLRRRE